MTNKGELPLEITDVQLPADGWYYLMVVRPLPRFQQSDYCLTLKSEDPESKAWETLDVAWPNNESDEDATLTSAEAKTAEETAVKESGELAPAEEPVTEATVEPSAMMAAPPIVEETTVDQTGELAPAED